MARRFLLLREEDISGVSGTGIVAEGIEFYDGVCALRRRHVFGHDRRWCPCDVPQLHRWHLRHGHGHVVDGDLRRVPGGRL